MNNEQNQRVERFYIRNPKALWKMLGGTPEYTSMIVEHVYFDTGHPTLFYTGFLRARRVVSDDDLLFDDEALFQLEFRSDGEDDLRVIEQRMTLADMASFANNHLELGHVSPIFGLRFERRRREIQGLRVDMDVDTTYFSLLADEPFEVGREDSHRMTLRQVGPELSGEELDQILDELSLAPCTAKKWMGFNFIKSCYELPRKDELAGYEYEVKLDVDSLQFDLGMLPFPVLEVFQSDSLRRYYRSYRACLRGDSAHLVEKGPVQSIGGVLKREETKKKGLQAWELPPPKMVMRRYKREVNILNPDTGRVYTLSLHHCDAGETFQQLEIEYDGCLVPGAVTVMARFRSNHDYRTLLTLAARADAAGWGSVGDELRYRYLNLAGEDANRELVDSSMSRGADIGPEPGTVDPAVEEAVVDDMILIRNALLRQGMRPSRLTKRKWLRRVYAERDE